MPDADIGLARGASVPFFDVTTTDGRRVRYDELWQRRALLLLSVPEDADAGVAASLRARVGHDAEVVVTADALPGLSHPGVLVADRWGEVQHVAPLGELDQADLAEWVCFVLIQCPECQGEAR